VGNIIIASVFVTIIARPIVGWICDRFGPRRTYACLLCFGAIPVGAIGLADSYEVFLVFRLLIGVVGASFVITQYHTSIMFAPNCVGRANATTAGWGNVGGGVTQFAMPALLSLFVWLGADSYWGWRLSMLVPAIAMFVMGIIYYRSTQDYPEGNLQRTSSSKKTKKERVLGSVIKDYRVWALFLLYGACFGIELTINNIASMYFYDRFDLSLTTAGLLAGLFGGMNLFARTTGGYVADRFGMVWGLSGKAMFLGVLLFLEGLFLIVFSQMDVLLFATIMLVIFAFTVQMASGATFAVVPFINRRAMGTVAGIVGAGGNAGAVAAGFLFRTDGISMETGLFYLGVAVMMTSVMAFALRFSPEDERIAAKEMVLANQTINEVVRA